MLGYFKDAFINDTEMLLPIQAKVVQYGLGTFEGVRAYWNAEEEQLYIFRGLEHFKRLLDSAKIFSMTPNYTAEELLDLTVQLLNKNNLRQTTYLRPLFYHASTKMAPVFENDDTEFAMYCFPLEDYLDKSKGIDVCISSWRRVSDNAIPARAKPTGLYLNSALAREEAYRNGYDEAIFLTNEGRVSEGTGEHFFMIREGVVFSPPSTEDNLDGITRKTIIQLVQDELNLPFVERGIARTELYTADEIFLVGTGAEVTGVNSVDRKPVGTGKMGELTKKIQTLYLDTVAGKHKKFQNWLTPVYK
jgi:branched-chain amino acid aminotransferase